jgi:sugar phosphate isomerase/epimerase
VARIPRIPRSGLGMHLYTVRDPLAADPLGTLTALAGMGYACVGVSSFPRPAAEIRDLCATAGLDPVVLHVGHADLTGDWPATLDAAATIGVRWLALSSFPDELATPAGMRLGARQLSEAGAAARERGMGVLHHNHATEFRVVDGHTLYQILLAETDPEVVGFELDVGWAHRAGASVRRLFAEYPGRFPCCTSRTTTARAAGPTWARAWSTSRTSSAPPNAAACGTGWWSGTTSRRPCSPRGTAWLIWRSSDFN